MPARPRDVPRRLGRPPAAAANKAELRDPGYPELLPDRHPDRDGGPCAPDVQRLRAVLECAASITENIMTFELPNLPYSRDALEPYISARTLDLHYGKHHQGYVDKLNAAVKGKPDAEKSLEEIIRSGSGAVFNNAAQVWNHTFYWRSMSPNANPEPTGNLADAIAGEFGDLATLKAQFAEAANGQFGSGWAWLVLGPNRRLSITKTSNAENPLTAGETPLLTLDVWEHAYYVDYFNDRAKYVRTFLDNLANWEFASKNFDNSD